MSITSDIINSLGKDFPVRFRLDFLCKGIRQFESETTPYINKFRKYLERRMRKFRIINNSSEHSEANDVFFYPFWGGFTYVHITIFSSNTLNNFIAALVRFSRGKTTLEIGKESIKLVIRE